MSQQNSLDDLQKTVLRRKISNFFERMTTVFGNPNSSQNLVNHGIATKISRCYDPLTGFSFGARNSIAQKLSKIQFFAFFTSLKPNSKDKRIFFLLKTPKEFLNSKNTTDQESFIKYALKAYCNEVSSDKLADLFNKTFPNQITQTQNECKNIIYEIVLNRGKFTNKLTSLFKDPETKNDVNAASDLIKAIEKSSFKIVADEEFDMDQLEGLTIIKSVFGQYS